MGRLTVLERVDVACDGPMISSLAVGGKASAGAVEIDAGGRLVTAGLVDCHTHACWAGSRLDEWERKLAGEDYLSILKAGGGIMSTVRSVRGASEAELAEELGGRLARLLAGGTTTVEVKSGYGLTTEAELKMLRAIARAARSWPGTVVATALLGHAIDPDEPNFVERVISETLPAISSEFPGIAVDAFCERGAWSLEQCVKLFEAAKRLGHPLRVHADQFTSLGMVRQAVRLGAVSVDHLEATTPEDAAFLARSRSIAVGLPVCVAHLGKSGGSSANLRSIVDGGGAVAVASNWNPGSAPSGSMPLVMGLAVRACGLTPGEALVAGTVNAAAVLGLNDRGRVQVGARADLVLWNCTDARELAFEFGGPGVAAVVAGGQMVVRAG
jgi:imidazolonepropionase